MTDVVMCTRGGGGEEGSRRDLEKATGAGKGEKLYVGSSFLGECT